MENHYSTLQILAAVVKELPNPTSYFCTPRELILRCSYDWTTIYSHLLLLKEESLVEIIHADTIQFAITQLGIDRDFILTNESTIVLKSNK
jgi:hypothetical protein